MRFSVIGEVAGVLRLRYVIEKDHAPAAHGDLEYRGTGAVEAADEILASQAHAFAASYLARKSAATV